MTKKKKNPEKTNNFVYFAGIQTIIIYKKVLIIRVHIGY